MSPSCGQLSRFGSLFWVLKVVRHPYKKGNSIPSLENYRGFGSGGNKSGFVCVEPGIGFGASDSGFAAYHVCEGKHLGQTIDLKSAL